MHTKLKIINCNSFWKRFKGLMLKKNINYILCFPKCNSIHTFFMLKPIDVIMTDKDYNILYIFYNLKPNRIVLPKKRVYYTYELPINTIRVKIGDKLNLKTGS